MKLKKLIVTLVFIVIIIFGSIKVLYGYMYPYKYGDIVNKYSKEYNLDPLFVLSVIKAESNFNSNAASHKDAQGLMQITDPTAKWAAEQMGITDYNKDMLKNPEFNVRMGCWYLDNLKKEFGDKDLVLAAYNGGRGKVNQWLKDNQYSKNGKDLHYIPFKETDKYVKKVNTNYKIYKFLYRNKYIKVIS